MIDAGTVIHTDGSKIGKASCAVVNVVSGGVFQKEIIKHFKNDIFSFATELQAVKIALEYADKNNLQKPIVIRTDSKSIVEIYESKSPTTVARDKSLWRKVFELGQKLDVKLEYIPGHQNEANPNTICDLTARSLCGTDL